MLAAPEPEPTPPLVDDGGYARLAALREGIRRYLAWAERCAKDHGLTPAQVQLALAVRSHPEPEGPNLTQLSETLLLRHNSVVGLVDRAAEAGLVERIADTRKNGQVRVQLTGVGADLLEAVSAQHLEWLGGHAPELASLWSSFASDGDPDRKD